MGWMLVTSIRVKKLIYYYYYYIMSIFSHALKLLGLIRTITFSFPTIDIIPMLYFALARSKLEYVLLLGTLLQLLIPTNLRA
jgi:hypothetical protein